MIRVLYIYQCHSFISKSNQFSYVIKATSIILKSEIKVQEELDAKIKNHGRNRFGRSREMKNRMKAALIGGALLGIVCVVGAYVRSGFSATPVFVFSLWYHRVIIGLVVGAPWGETVRNKALLRGALLGLLVSFAFYSTTEFQDPISFVAGIVYGVLLEGWLSRTGKTRKL